MFRSNLYRLFEDAWGVTRYIQRERLLEARAILFDPEKTQSISAICRGPLFRRRVQLQPHLQTGFGYSPSETRYAALSGLELGATPKTRAPSAGADFGQLLRGI